MVDPKQLQTWQDRALENAKKLQEAQDAKKAAPTPEQALQTKLQALEATIQNSTTASAELKQGFADLLSTVRDGFTKLQPAVQPDVASPIVAAVSRLETALKQVAAVKPEVNVAAPSVKVDAPAVDLSGIQGIIKKDIPAAFSQAIAQIPAPVPDDNSNLEQRLDAVISKLESIDIATRLKPQAPTQIKVTNTDGSPIGGGTFVTVPFNEVDATYPDAVTEVYTYKNGGTTVATLTVTYSDSTKANLTTVVRT